MEGEKERQGDFVFTANEVGEYRFCFDNTVSTFTDKLVDFEIAVRRIPRSMASIAPRSIANTRFNNRSRTKSARKSRRKPARPRSSSAASRRR